MPSNIHPCVAWRNAALDLMNAQLGANPRMRAYSGTQPTTCDTALGAQVLLADIPLPTNPFGTAASGVVTLGGLPLDDASADATAAATWVSFTTSAGVRKLDVSAAASGGDIIATPNASITAGDIVRAIAFSWGLAA